MKDIHFETPSDFINREKIENAKKAVQYPIVPLPAKTGVKRYSIRGNDGTCSFVTITTNAFNRKTVRCSSGRCQTYGKPRKMISLRSTKICCHLQKLRDTLPDTELADCSDDEDEDDDDNADITIPTEKVSLMSVNEFT